MISFLSGLLLGLTMIIPIGVQNLFVLNLGVSVGFPRALVGVTTLCLFETLLIILGDAGASALRVALGYREVLIVVGGVFLVVLSHLTLRAHPHHLEAKHLTPITVTVAEVVAVSVLKPHAILDTVGVLTGAVAAPAADERAISAAGVVGASCVWYLLLSMGASAFQKRITSSVRLWIQRGSGMLMLIFADVFVVGI
jgi:L-lysine exporter family protein LysE/ArgO